MEQRKLERILSGPWVSPIVLRLVLTAAMSSLFVVFRLIPTFPMVGVPGATFRAGDIIAPLYGVIMGPLLGPLSVGIGTLIGYFAGAPPVFLGLDFLPASTCSAIVGLATRRRGREAVVLYTGLIVLFLSLPLTSVFIKVGNYQVPYVWFHLLGVAILVSPLGRWAARLVREDWTSLLRQPRAWQSQFLAMLTLSLAGTLAQHVMGGTVNEIVVGINFHSLPGRRGQFSTWQDFWTLIFYVYPIERTIIALFAALLASSTIVALKASGLTSKLPST